MPTSTSRALEKHQGVMSRPFETMLASGHFVFSHGHLLKAAPHDVSMTNVAWEELWMTYAYWKTGYTLYSPVKSSVYHLYDIEYKHKLDVDKNPESGGEGVY